MNKAFLVGRPTGAPKVTYTTGGMAIAKFTLAVDRRFRKEGEPTADFINCVAFGKTAEFVEKYVTKGTKLFTSGRIQTGSYTNKDGVKVYTTDVVIDECEFAESKAKEPVNEPNDGFMTIPDGVEELPFN